MEIGSRGCIFLHPTCGGVEGIREILLGGGPISTSVSMLRTCSSPLRFHQVIEDSNCLSSENTHFDHNLSGRYALNRKDSRECSDVSPYSDPPIAGAGVCDKSKGRRPYSFCHAYRKYDDKLFDPPTHLLIGKTGVTQVTSLL